jgi:deoxyribodipyrimidine photo-lyase
MSKTMRPRTIIWFRNDLRLGDNATVQAAVQSATAGHDVLPVYCFDDRFMRAANVLDRHPYSRKEGTSKMGGHRAKFVLQCVEDLKRSLQAVDSDLLVYCGRPEAVIPGVWTGRKIPAHLLIFPLVM